MYPDRDYVESCSFLFICSAFNNDIVMGFGLTLPTIINQIILVNFSLTGFINATIFLYRQRITSKTEKEQAATQTSLNTKILNISLGSDNSITA